jgi:hypothetical protein
MIKGVPVYMRPTHSCTSGNVWPPFARPALQAVEMPDPGSEPKTFIFNEMSSTEIKQTQAYTVRVVYC